jgi:hypothetical protein
MSFFPSATKFNSSQNRYKGNASKKKTHMADQFECAVCCSTFHANARNKPLQCGLCSFLACNHCQKQYLQSTCMNCRAEFPPKSLGNALGKAFVHKELTKAKTAAIVLEETKLIPDTQPLLDWLDRKKQREENFYRGAVDLALGFAIEDVMPIITPLTTRLGKSNAPVPCSAANCRGFLLRATEDNESGTYCQVCKVPHCNACFQPTSPKANATEHVCDKGVLESLKAIEASCTPCPGCHVDIFKTVGCDHMNCTNCGIHFSYKTGRKLNISTNNHYPNMVAIRNQQRPPEEDANNCNVNVDADHIPLDALLEKHGDALFHTTAHVQQALYDHPALVRTMRDETYNTTKLLRQYCVKKDAIRVRYIRHELTEARWGSTLLAAHVLQVRNDTIADILTLYLEFVGETQSRLYHAPDAKAELNATFDLVVQMLHACNASLEAAYENLYSEDVNMTEKLHFTIPAADAFNPRAIPIAQLSRKRKEMTKTCQQPTKKKRAGKQKEKAGEDEKEEDATAEKAKEAKHKRIQLLDYQVPHFAKICHSLERHNYAIDLSALGTGKTYIAAKYVQTHHFRDVYVFCPASLRAKWQQVTQEYHIPAYIISYSEIGGSLHVQPKHGLLERNDFIQQRRYDTVKLVRYEPTPRLEQMMDTYRGACFIFDEFQHVKAETSNTTRAARAILSLLLRNTFENKALLLSGTPFDKLAQVTTMFRNLGVQTSAELFEYVPGLGRSTSTGYREILDYCADMDCEEKFTAYMKNALLARNVLTARPHVLGVFMHHIKHYTASAMSMPVRTGGCTITNINAYYALGGDDERLYRSAITKLMRLANADNHQQQQRRVGLEVFRALQLLEVSKVSTIVACAADALRSDPNAKVVIAMHYTRTIEEVMHALEQMGFSPQCINGKLPPKQRQQHIDAFQAPTTASRLLVCNMTVVSSGLDLDDKHGDFPRHVFVNPTFKTMDMYQHSCRYLRSLDTKSSTVIRYIYASNLLSADALDFCGKGTQTMPADNLFRTKGCEARLLTSILRKSTVMHAVSETADLSFLYEVVSAPFEPVAESSEPIDDFIDPDDVDI